MRLTDIPVVFICPDHNEKYNARKKHMFSLLEEIGFNDITFFKSRTDLYNGLNIAHAVSEILKTRLDDNPVLIVEDDIEKTEWFQTEIDIPKDADAFYLGFSRMRRADNGMEAVPTNMSAIIEDVGPNLIRIKNMLSTHAQIFVSKRIKEATICLYRQIVALNSQIQNDLISSTLQLTCNVYGYTYPLFYQSMKHNNHYAVEYSTRFSFSPRFVMPFECPYSY